MTMRMNMCIYHTWYHYRIFSGYYFIIFSRLYLYRVRDLLDPVVLNDYIFLLKYGFCTILSVNQTSVNQLSFKSNFFFEREAFMLPFRFPSVN